MADIPHTLRAEIDLSAIRHNAALLRHAAGDADLVAVVKADAYGHGADAVTAALAADGVSRFAVATLAEAAALRTGGYDGWLLLFAAPRPEMLPAAERLGLALTVSSREVAEDVAAYADAGGTLTVHIKVDTGMHRLGVSPDDTAEVVARLRAGGVTVEGLWTHFATADGADGTDAQFVAEQTRRFQHALDTAASAGLAPPLVHVLNGPALTRGLGTLRLPTGTRSLARAGGALYGLRSGEGLTAPMADYRPAMRLVADVVHLQTVAAGETVSYGRTWRASRPTRIATLPAGYADGVPRGLSNSGQVGIGGRLWPVAGRVCMDMMMVNLGDPDGPGSAISLGDEAVLWGPGGPSAEAAAASAGTMAYELTAGLTARVARIPKAAERELE